MRAMIWLNSGGQEMDEDPTEGQDPYNWWYAQHKTHLLHHTNSGLTSESLGTVPKGQVTGT